MKKIPSGISLIISLPFLTSASAELKQEYIGRGYENWAI
jgi:hypothetical protein